MEKFGFVKHLKSWTYNSYHKNSFSNSFAKKFSKIFKIFVLQDSTYRVYFLTNQNGKRKGQFFSLNSRACSIPSRFLSISRAYFHVHFNSFQIPLDQLDFFFKNTYRNRIRLFKTTLCLSLWFLLTKNFIVVFLGQRLKGFLQTLKVRHFFPFFFIKLHDFMHFSCIFLGIFALLEFWGFWCFCAFWPQLNHGFFFMHHLNIIPIL